MNSNNYKIYSPTYLTELLIKALLMFIYIYEINLSVFGLPTFVTSRRLVVFGLLLFLIVWRNFDYIFSRKRFGKYWGPFKSILNLQFFILAYSILLLVTIGRGEGSHIYESSLRLLLFGFLPILLFKDIFRDIDDFMRALLLATIIQSLFVTYSLINPLFGEFLDSTFVLDEDYATRHRAGYAGGLNCITAPGCLKFSMGLVAALYFVIKNKSILYYAIFVYLGVVATMIARTGLLLSFCGMFFIIYNGIKRSGIKMVFTVILPLFILGYFLFIFTNNGGFEGIFEFNRLQNLSDNGKLNDDGFFSAYFSGEDTIIPPLGIDTLLGIGITSGISGSGIPVNVDGGFIRIYAALGIFICVIFYLNFFGQCLRIRNKINDQTIKAVVSYFIVILLLGEFKEFTIFEQYMVGILFTIVALYNKNLSVKLN